MSAHLLAPRAFARAFASPAPRPARLSRRYGNAVRSALSATVLGAAALTLGACAAPPPAEVARPPAPPAPQGQAEAKKAQLVAKLAECESGNQPVYSPGRVYVGPLQFHRTTVVGYYRTLYGQQISTQEAVEIAMDQSRSHALAKDIIFTSGNGVRDWPLCSRKLGLHDEVNRIMAEEQ